MNIAIIHSHLDNRGGSQRYVIEIARELIHLGVKVKIFAYDYHKDRCFPELVEGIPIVAVNDLRAHHETLNSGFKSIPNSRKLIQKLYSFEILRKIWIFLGLEVLHMMLLIHLRSKKLSALISSENENYDLYFAHEEPMSIWAAAYSKRISKVPLYWFVMTLSLNGTFIG